MPGTLGSALDRQMLNKTVMLLAWRVFATWGWVGSIIFYHPPALFSSIFGHGKVANEWTNAAFEGGSEKGGWRMFFLGIYVGDVVQS